MSTTLALLVLGGVISTTLLAISWRRANKVIALAEAEQRQDERRRQALAEIAELDPDTGEWLAALEEPAPRESDRRRDVRESDA